MFVVLVIFIVDFKPILDFAPTNRELLHTIFCFATWACLKCYNVLLICRKFLIFWGKMLQMDVTYIKKLLHAIFFVTRSDAHD
jgi:hypothetical protein